MPYVEKLKAIRDEKKITNVEIAKISNIPLATVTRVFNGQTPNPTFETISRIAVALGISLDEIIGLKEPDEPPVVPRIETALNSYSELLQEKDERIRELKEEKERERKDRYKVTSVLICVVCFLLLLLAFDLINGQLGYFRK
jgi:transcriptional regulator with XRE-family HTH domain